MKLHPSSAAFYNTFTAYGPGYVEINEVRYTGSILVQPEGPIVTWPVACFEALEEQHFDQVAALGAEVVLFGSGARLRFPAPALSRPLTRARIGLEVMDLFAACRTYNILMAEGRRVAAALIIEPSVA